MHPPFLCYVAFCACLFTDTDDIRTGQPTVILTMGNTQRPPIEPHAGINSSKVEIQDNNIEVFSKFCFHFGLNRNTEQTENNWTIR